MKIITHADPKIILPLRRDILRPNKPLTIARYDIDNLPDTVHFALIQNDIVNSIATIFPENLSNFGVENGYRLRGMATRLQNQRNGLGSRVLHSVFTYLEENTKALYLWCNVRESAFNFYLKSGFELKGDLFEIPDIGPHKIAIYRLRNKRK